jgi:hypothetical protein
MALTLNTKVILVNEDVDLTQKKDAINNDKVVITTVGELLELALPAIPTDGTYFLLSTDGVLSWELFVGGGEV